MAYVVLARRYRPQIFADLVGQEHVTATLKNALKTGRTAHAYLFTGPRGVGKTSAARILAKALRCLEPTPDFEPCNKCDACVGVNNGSSMDVLEIDAASNTGVDNIRELRENVGYMATIGKYRIYIIDEVHMLSTAAFNALLKTLEEPPPHVVFIFATTELHKVLTTIQSRCQRFDFKKISSEIISKNLKEICTQEKVKIDDASVRTLVFESEGCLRDAQSLLDQAIALCGSEIKIEVLEKALGLVDRASFLNLMTSIGDHEAGKALKLCTQILDRGIDGKILLGRMVDFLRDLHYRSFTGESPVQDETWENALATLSSRLSQDEIVRAMDLALKAQSSLYSALNTNLLVEALIVKLCLQRPINLSTNTKTEASNESPQRSKPVTASAPILAHPQQESTGGSYTLSELENYIYKNKPAWGPVLQSIHSMEFKDDILHVRAKNDFAGRRLASTDGSDVLKLAYKVNRVAVQLDQAQAAPNPVNQNQRLIEKRSQAKEHDAVKAAIRIFDAVVTDTKILEDEKPR